MSRHTISWTRNTHGHPNGENKVRYEDVQVAVADLRNMDLRTPNTLLFDYVILTYMRVRIAYDAHKQWGVNIAIYEENYFWQSPSEPWGWMGSGHS